MGEPVVSCTIEIRVRYAETDAMGYLHHAQYFVYFEQGRTELLRQTGVRYRDMEERGLFYVVGRLECRYRAPARYDDVLSLTTTTEDISPLLVKHAYRVCRGDTLIAEAKSTLVAVGRDGRPTPVPDDFYALMTGQMPRP